MRVRMLMRMIGLVLVDMGMDGFGRWQFLSRMRVSPIKMKRMIMTSPEILKPIIGYQQAFAMMPPTAKDVIILFALGRTLFLASTEPFTMRMSLDAFSHLWRRRDTITG